MTHWRIRHTNDEYESRKYFSFYCWVGVACSSASCLRSTQATDRGPLSVSTARMRSLRTKHVLVLHPLMVCILLHHTIDVTVHWVRARFSPLHILRLRLGFSLATIGYVRVVESVKCINKMIRWEFRWRNPKEKTFSAQHSSCMRRFQSGVPSTINTKYEKQQKRKKRIPNCLKWKTIFHWPCDLPEQQRQQ